MFIRKATIDDLNEITEVEARCFPVAEAASKESFKQRLEVFPNCFWLLEDNGKIISFINGMVINEQIISDEMFADATLHQENGAWQAIFGVNTLPEYRYLGYASKVMKVVIEDARNQGRVGCVLTCKEQLIPFYERFGFVNYGLSKSNHGGAIWFDMRLEF